MKLTRPTLILIVAGFLSVPQTANACRIPMTPEQVAAVDERYLGSADQVIVGDVAANRVLPNYIDRVDLVNVRALRGQVPPTITIQQEKLILGCGQSFGQSLENIGTEPVLILLKEGSALQIYHLNSPFAQSVIERLDATSK